MSNSQCTCPICLCWLASLPVCPQIRFNMNNRAELISNGRRRVYFWASSPTSSRFKYYSPPLRSKDFKQSVRMGFKSVDRPWGA